MKKYFLLLMLMIGSATTNRALALKHPRTLAAHADSYTYLTFEITDGTRVSVPAWPLTITISGTTLIAGDQSFTLANLNKMYFSADDQTTGIVSVTSADLDEVTAIFDLNGLQVTKDQTKKGVYIVKTKDRTCKIIVR